MYTTVTVLESLPELLVNTSIPVQPCVHFVGWFMVFNATINNISVISWWSVLLVEEIRVPGENHRPAASH